ncbi:TetR/AcrR family transcriptional regulator [Sorangium sp. So ce542]|uniref:TetR/AcrR family transcriptional regulator n=1 Tax=Sorangium sp. So ce542 TaxID=3133316 RepID=UPI003F645083
MRTAGSATDHDKKEAILAAALELFVERGFYGTSVPSIAERAGVAAGTIYHYFDSKEALVNALFKRWKAEISSKVFQDLPVDRPPREQFRLAWERLADFALAHPKELAFLELHHHGSYLDQESRDLENRVLELGVEMVKRAQVAQALKPLPPTFLMELANGAFLGVFRGALQGRFPLDRATLMDAERCCWEALRA